MFPAEKKRQQIVIKIMIREQLNQPIRPNEK